MSSSPLTRPAPIGAAPADERLLIPGRDAARMLGGISERTLYAMTAPRGPIASVRIGRADSGNPRVLYSVETLRAWIAAQTASASAST